MELLSLGLAGVFLLVPHFSASTPLRPAAVLQDMKKRRDLGEPWQQWEAVTSNVPFQAILQGRVGFRFDGGLVVHIVVGIAVYAGLLFAHPWLAGVGIVPG
ncbi:MAG: hypothetical protein AAFV53_31230 [Myxococcota bacterium]